MTYYDPRRPKPWPIRLLNNWGITDDQKATNIVLLVIGVLFVVAIFFYLSSGTPEVEQIDPQILLDMERGL